MLLNFARARPRDIAAGTEASRVHRGFAIVISVSRNVDQRCQIIGDFYHRIGDRAEKRPARKSDQPKSCNVLPDVQSTVPTKLGISF